MLELQQKMADSLAKLVAYENGDQKERPSLAAGFARGSGES